MKFNLKEKLKVKLSYRDINLTVFYTRSGESFQLANTVLILKMHSLVLEKYLIEEACQLCL